jgi:hypothetical protein
VASRSSQGGKRSVPRQVLSCDVPARRGRSGEQELELFWVIQEIGRRAVVEVSPGMLEPLNHAWAGKTVTKLVDDPGDDS